MLPDPGDRKDSPEAQDLRMRVMRLRWDLVEISSGDVQADNAERRPMIEKTRDLRLEHITLVGWDPDEVFYGG